MKYVPSWFPGAGFKRDAALWKGKMEAFVNQPYDYTKQQMVRVFLALCVPCFACHCGCVSCTFALACVTDTITPVDLCMGVRG